jgi:hypothetical protein
MGSDFLQRAGGTLRRSWDKGRVTAATPDLMTREVVSGGRGITADMVKGTAVSAGEHVTVQIEGGALVARRCLTPVARNDSPPAAIIEIFSRHCNVRSGTVSQVHDMAGMVEITITC